MYFGLCRKCAGGPIVKVREVVFKYSVRPRVAPLPSRASVPALGLPQSKPSVGTTAAVRGASDPEGMGCRDDAVSARFPVHSRPHRRVVVGLKGHHEVVGEPTKSSCPSRVVAQSRCDSRRYYRDKTGFDLRQTDDNVDNVKTRSDDPTTSRRENVNIVSNAECQRHRYRPSLSHQPSRLLNVNALIWLALQIGNEPSTTDDYLLSNGESERRRWAGQRRT